MMDAETGIFHEWSTDNIKTTFFKCTRWQVEETTDLLNCPFHYFCDSSYAGNFPPIADMSALAAVVGSFLSSSGPVMLPLMLLLLANGQRINTFFPLSQMGPSILLLIHVSALAFEKKTDQSGLRYAVLEASTLTGILRASLNLDSIIQPYYTGLDALSRSFFSDECPSCVCRKEELVVGGRLVLYRGWSKTTVFIMIAQCSRMLCRISGENKFTMMIKLILEVIGWVSVAGDAIYLTIAIPFERSILKVMIYGGICVLISFNVFRRMYRLYVWLVLRHKIKKMKDVCLNNVEIQ